MIEVLAEEGRLKVKDNILLRREVENLQSKLELQEIRSSDNDKIREELDNKIKKLEEKTNDKKQSLEQMRCQLTKYETSNSKQSKEISGITE